MRDNKEFKQLVKEKHLRMLKKRKRNIVLCNTAVSLIVCFILCISIFFVNNAARDNDVFNLLASIITKDDINGSETSPSPTQPFPQPSPTESESARGEIQPTEKPVVQPTEIPAPKNDRGWTVTVDVHNKNSDVIYNFSDLDGETDAVDYIMAWAMYIYNENSGEKLILNVIPDHNEYIKISFDTGDTQSWTFTMLDGKYMNMSGNIWIKLNYTLNTSEFINNMKNYN